MAADPLLGQICHPLPICMQHFLLQPRTHASKHTMKRNLTIWRSLARVRIRATTFLSISVQIYKVEQSPRTTDHDLQERCRSGVTHASRWTRASVFCPDLLNGVAHEHQEQPTDRDHEHEYHEHYERQPVNRPATWPTNHQIYDPTQADPYLRHYLLDRSGKPT